MRILIVEDEMIHAAYLEVLLKMNQFEVCGMTAYGHEAVKLAFTLLPDVILMNIYLSDDMTGIEAVKKIHRQQQIPVIYISASSDPITVKKMKKTSYLDFLIKPIDERQLISLIKNVNEIHINMTYNYQDILKNFNQP